jgi:hypothetical protein
MDRSVCISPVSNAQTVSLDNFPRISVTNKGLRGGPRAGFLDMDLDRRNAA